MGDEVGQNHWTDEAKAPGVRPAGAPCSEASTSSPALQPPRGARLGIARLFEPISIVPLVYARIVFGAIMLWEVSRYFEYGWIRRYFIEPRYHFTYYGFEWVHPWPGHWMYVHFAVMGAAAACILLGLWCRLAALVFFIGFTHVFLIEEALYLNHFYMVALVSGLMIFLPVNRAASLDALLRPRIRSNVAPVWTISLLRFQIGIVYFFGGVAKLNSDWLRGEPMRMWLASRADFPLVGDYFTHALAPYFFSYGGLLLDLFVVPLLIWKRTRLPALAAIVFFHLMNSILFHIGIFPWFMLATTPLFFPTAWWGRLGRRYFGIPEPGQDATTTAAAESAGRHELQSMGTGLSGPARPAGLRPGQRITAALLSVFVLLQLLIPLRHWLYPGKVQWTEEGHRFSWRMKLRSKTGRLALDACDPNTRMCWPVNLRRYAEPWQLRKTVGTPDMILQLAHFAADDLRRQGYPDIEIYAEAMVSLNGRELQPLIDPYTDLAREQRSLRPARWILPMKDTPPGRQRTVTILRPEE